MMRWWLSHRCDPKARVLADNHYSRQKVGAVGFVPPGRCLVLVTQPADAYWVTSYPYAEYVRHEWAGALMCSAYRSEGSHLSSEAIREAVACTLWKWPSPPLGMVTFVDPSKVAGFIRRTATGPVMEWGYSFQKAGFRYCGWTQGGLFALQLLPDDMPEPRAPRSQMDAQMSFLTPGVL